MTNRPSRKTFNKRLNELTSTLKEEIVTGKLSVGEYLPSEIDLGKRFGLSKNSIRKGLDILVSESMIEKVPRVGNRILRPEKDQSVTIKFGYYKSLISEAKIYELLLAFQKEYPHIRVQAFSLSTEGYHEMIREHMNNNMLDIMTINYPDFQYFAEDIEFKPFEPLEINAELYPFLSDAFIRNNYLYAQPFIFSPVILGYNRDHFREKNLPEPDSSWNWNHLLETAIQLGDRDKSRYGFYFHLLSINRWLVFLLQSGMNFKQNEDGKYRINFNRLIDNLQVARDLIYQQNILPSFTTEKDIDVEELFFQRNVSMIMTTYLSLSHSRDAKFNFDVAPLPYSHEPRTLMLIMGLAINRNSHVKKPANELIKYLVSYESQLKIRKETLSIPAHKKAAEWTGKEKISRPSRFHMYREIIPTFRLPSDLRLPYRDLNRISRELKRFWSLLENSDSVAKRIEELLSQSFRQ